MLVLLNLKWSPPVTKDVVFTFCPCLPEFKDTFLGRYGPLRLLKPGGCKYMPSVLTYRVLKSLSDRVEIQKNHIQGGLSVSEIIYPILFKLFLGSLPQMPQVQRSRGRMSGSWAQIISDGQPGGEIMFLAICNDWNADHPLLFYIQRILSIKSNLVPKVSWASHNC